MSDLVVIAPEGELDLLASRTLAPQLNEAAGASFPVLVIDLTAVSFIDSTGLGGILQAHQRLERQGRALRIVAPHGSAAAVLIELSGLATMFAVFTTLDEATALDPGTPASETMPA